MKREVIIKNLDEIKEKFERLEKTGMQGLSHLIEYLKMKDDKDFEDLAPDVLKLLIALYHVNEEEEKYLEVLEANNDEMAAQEIGKIIKRLVGEIEKDEKAIKNHESIDPEKLAELTILFRDKATDLLSKSVS